MCQLGVGSRLSALGLSEVSIESDDGMLQKDTRVVSTLAQLPPIRATTGAESVKNAHSNVRAVSWQMHGLAMWWQLGMVGLAAGRKKALRAGERGTNHELRT